VRITAQLIDARSDDHLWSETYDRQLTDVFAVQDEIASHIVDALQVQLSAGDRDALHRQAPTTSIQAYDYYLRGRQYIDDHRPEAHRRAREMFQKAIEIDPEYALAYAGLADTFSHTALWFEATPETKAGADAASRRALELSPDLAEAHAARGFALYMSGEHEVASAEFEKAIELDPHLFEAYYLYGRTRFAQGKAEEAAELLGKAHAARPDDFQAPAIQSTAYQVLGRSEDMLAAGRRAIEIAERRLEVTPDDSRALTLGASILVMIGRVDEGLAWSEKALALYPDDLTVLYNSACAYASAGHTERALDLLERRLRHKTIHRDWLEHDPDFDSVRDHPRFKALLASLDE
jgi:adenylate cyclase